MGASRNFGKFVVMLGTSPDAQGGIATVVQNYQSSGLLAKWKVRYIVTHTQESVYAKLKVALSAFLRLFGMLLANQVALVHVHMSSRYSTWRKSAFLLLAMLFRVPTLIHVHGGNYVDFFNHQCGFLQRALIRFLLRRSSRVIALSPSWCADIRSIEPMARTTVLYNSVPLPDLGKQAIDHQGQFAPIILFLGLISAPKGAFDLLKAASCLHEDFRLVIGGEGDLGAARAAVASLSLGDKVSFPGWIRGKEKDVLLAQAQIFVLPSYFEGVPMAILEAMSWAKPVVATNVGGIPDVICDGREGLLVPPGDISVLTAALNRLLADPALRQRMGNAGRKRIEHEYSQEVLHPQLEELWVESGALPPDRIGRVI
jgi:glycosyltransferase involved in cell wall biosynthesis